MAPEFERPVPPVPTQWPVAADGISRSSAAAIHWRTFFPDPRLQALIQAALENNRDLRVAAARVEEARAQFGITRADQLPTVNLQASGSEVRTPGELSGTGEAVTSQRYDVSLSAVSYEVDFWGRIAGLSEAARRSYLATEDAKRVVTLSLISDVASAYFTVLQMDALAQLMQEAVTARENTLDLVGKARDIGAVYDYEYQQSSSLLESSRAALDSIDYQRTVATNRLNFLIGTMPKDLPQGLGLDAQGLDTQLAAGVPAEVLLLRPDVMAAEQRLRAANANIGAARAAFLPKVLLTASLGVASKGLSSLFDGSTWAFQPTIGMPLFDAGRLSSSVDVAQARKVIAVAEYEKTIQLAFREVADLLAARDSLARQLRAAMFNEAAQAKRLEISQARHEVGLISYLEVLDGQRELVAARQMTTQVRRAQFESAAQLYRALGGGMMAEKDEAGS